MTYLPNIAVLAQSNTNTTPVLISGNSQDESPAAYSPFSPPMYNYTNSMVTHPMIVGHQSFIQYMNYQMHAHNIVNPSPPQFPTPNRLMMNAAAAAGFIPILSANNNTISCNFPYQSRLPKPIKKVSSAKKVQEMTRKPKPRPKRNTVPIRISQSSSKSSSSSECGDSECSYSSGSSSSSSREDTPTPDFSSNDEKNNTSQLDPPSVNPTLYYSTTQPVETEMHEKRKRSFCNRSNRPQKWDNYTDSEYKVEHNMMMQLNTKRRDLNYRRKRNSAAPVRTRSYSKDNQIIGRSRSERKPVSPRRKRKSEIRSKSKPRPRDIPDRCYYLNYSPVSDRQTADEPSGAILPIITKSSNQPGLVLKQSKTNKAIAKTPQFARPIRQSGESETRIKQYPAFHKLQTTAEISNQSSKIICGTNSNQNRNRLINRNSGSSSRGSFELQFEEERGSKSHTHNARSLSDVHFGMTSLQRLECSRTLLLKTKNSKTFQFIFKCMSRKSVFKNLKTSSLRRVVDQMYMIDLVSGDYIMKVGEINENFIIIEKGALKQWQPSNKNAENCNSNNKKPADAQIIRCLKRGCSFGAKALLYPTKQTYMCSAIIATRIWVLKADVFHNIVFPSSSLTPSPYESPSESPSESPIVSPSSRRNRETMPLRFLKRIWIFRHLSFAELEQVAESATQYRFKRGQKIITQHETATMFFMLYRGRCNAYIRDKHNREVLVKEYKQNDVFGELGIITKQARAATIEVVSTEVIVYALAGNDFRELLSNKRIYNDVRKITCSYSRYN